MKCWRSFSLARHVCALSFIQNEVCVSMTDDVFKRIENKERRTLFKDERIFSADYRPQSIEEVKHRDDKIEKIVEAIARTMKGVRAELYEYGSPGAGKTVITWTTLDNVPKDWTEKFQWAWVNCKTVQPFSGYQVFKEISAQLGRRWGKGHSTKDVKDSVVRAHREKPLLVVLDEADVLVEEKQFGLLYTFFDAKISLILISNVFNWTDEADMRIKSRSMDESHRTVFADYKRAEMKDILELVAEKGLKKGVISSEILEKIADYTVDVLAGDVRKGKFLMFGCVDEAMEERVDAVTKGHLAKALDKIKPMSLKDMLKNFSRAVLLALAGYVTQRINLNNPLGGGKGGGGGFGNAPATTDNIYYFYKEVAKLNGMEPVGETMMKNYLKRIEAGGILTHGTLSYKTRGRTNIYYSDDYKTKDIGQTLWDLGIKLPFRGVIGNGWTQKHDLFE